MPLSNIHKEAMYVPSSLGRSIDSELINTTRAILELWEGRRKQMSLKLKGDRVRDISGGPWKRNRNLPCRIGERKGNMAEETVSRDSEAENVRPVSTWLVEVRPEGGRARWCRPCKPR